MDTKQKIEHVHRMIRVVKSAIATYRQRGRKVNEGYERERLELLERELAELESRADAHPDAPAPESQKPITPQK